MIYECRMNRVSASVFIWVPSHIKIEGNERVDESERQDGDGKFRRTS